MLLSLCLAVVVFAPVLFLVFYNFYYKRRSLPPGPAPLPLVGNLLDIVKQGSGEDAFIKWKRQFGDVYTYWMGEQPIVAVNDYSKIVDTFQKDSETFAGRTFAQELRVYVGGDVMRGVLLTEGEVWRDQRRFALHVLRDFGMGKNLMQERVLDEVTGVISELKQDILRKQHEEHDLPAHIDIGVGSVINALLFGYRWDKEREKEFFELKEMMSEFIKAYVHPMFAILRINYSPLFHFCIKLPYIKQKAEHIRTVFRGLFAFYQRQIDEHLKHIDLDSQEEPKDYAEAFLREQAKRDKAGEQHHYTRNQLVAMCFDLFIAGQETTSTTLAWGFAYLLHNPEVQKKVHAELDSVIGSDRIITIDDKNSLPYLNAVICETHRVCNLLPQNMLHRTTKDVVVDGYHLPEGTCVVPQLSSIFYDDKVFSNPKKFDPGRFLDDEGKLRRVDELIPFSIGKRQCLGESLARMEMFLFMANLLNQFKFSVGKEAPSMTRTFAGTVQCPPYKCRVDSRY